MPRTNAILNVSISLSMLLSAALSASANPAHAAECRDRSLRATLDSLESLENGAQAGPPHGKLVRVPITRKGMMEYMPLSEDFGVELVGTSTFARMFQDYLNHLQREGQALSLEAIRANRKLIARVCQEVDRGRLNRDHADTRSIDVLDLVAEVSGPEARPQRLPETLAARDVAPHASEARTVERKSPKSNVDRRPAVDPVASGKLVPEPVAIAPPMAAPSSSAFPRALLWALLVAALAGAMAVVTWLRIAALKRAQSSSEVRQLAAPAAEAVAPVISLADKRKPDSGNSGGQANDDSGKRAA